MLLGEPDWLRSSYVRNEFTRSHRNRVTVLTALVADTLATKEQATAKKNVPQCDSIVFARAYNIATTERIRTLVQWFLKTITHRLRCNFQASTTCKIRGSPTSFSDDRRRSGLMAFFAFCSHLEACSRRFGDLIRAFMLLSNCSKASPRAVPSRQPRRQEVGGNQLA